MGTIPLLDLHQFHDVDRTLFSRLVVQLSRIPSETILTMAFWFWLEDNHYPCLVTRLLSASDLIVNKIADEAMICLNSLAPDGIMPVLSDTAFTTTMLGRNLPLAMMHRDKSAAINGIKYFLNNVCTRIFTDILDRNLGGNREARPFYHPLIVPGFPHPVFGDVNIIKLPLFEPCYLEELWGWQMPSF